MTGVGTVLADNPRLDVREVATTRQPQVVVVDSQLRTPPDAALLQAARTCTVAYSTPLQEDAAAQARAHALTARGVRLVHLPNAQGQVDLAALLRQLGAWAINELHVEAGPRLNGALVQAGVVDEWLLYLAPKLLGQGRPLADWAGVTRLAEAPALRFTSVEPVGPDLRLLARPA